MLRVLFWGTVVVARHKNENEACPSLLVVLCTPLGCRALFFTSCLTCMYTFVHIHPWTYLPLPIYFIPAGSGFRVPGYPQRSGLRGTKMILHIAREEPVILVAPGLCNGTLFPGAPPGHSNFVLFGACFDVLDRIFGIEANRARHWKVQADTPK